jgi:hypothetical protein
MTGSRLGHLLALLLIAFQPLAVAVVREGAPAAEFLPKHVIAKFLFEARSGGGKRRDPVWLIPSALPRAQLRHGSRRLRRLFLAGKVPPCQRQ